MPSKRLSRSGTPSAAQKRVRERRLGARRLAHARAGPERALDDVAGAAELAEALRHRARGLPRLVAAGRDRARAGRGDAPGAPGDARAQRGEGVVRDERSPPRPRTSSAPARRT